MGNFIENLRQLVYMMCVVGILSLWLGGLWWFICQICGWDYLVDDEEDGEDE
jgi:uncharacterized membrane protein